MSATPTATPSLALPVLPPQRPPAGFVRLAAEAEELAQRKEAEYRELPCRSLINRCESARVSFPWTINPYRGCAFGCVYCYARYTHEFMVAKEAVTRDPSYDEVPETILDFERRVYVKTGAAEALREELRRRDYRGEHIAIGTATDPYQPAERRYGITRSLLEVFAERRGMSLSITTKSDLVARDVELLRRIDEHSLLRVNVTVTTVDSRLAHELEPRAPRPDKRLAAVRTLVDAGIPAGVFAMPIIPLVNDAPEQLEALVAAVAQSGACYFCANVLFLRDCSRARFFPWLKATRPETFARLRALMNRDAEVIDAEAERIRETLRRLRAKYGLESRLPTRPSPPRDQMALEL